jgi:formylglycine-generating enzyme required for sulfatase activity
MTFVYIPPGSFTMGSPTSETGRKSDEVAHLVTLTRGFFLQTTEVTQKQWVSLMGRNPSEFQYFMTNTDDRPVEKVSWDDAVDFIAALNRAEGTDTYRLPTEAEWEYAARAGTTTAYSWGDQPDCGRMVYATRTVTGSYDREECNKPFRARGLPRGATSPVKSMPPNPWGLYDMHGNVWEWVNDWYGKIDAGSPRIDPTGPPSGTLHVFRGGSWDSSARDTRSANRLWGTPNAMLRKTPSFRSPERGFRVARTP